MPEVECSNIKCPNNKPHPSGKGRTCGITVLPIDEYGSCEYWNGVQETKIYEISTKILDWSFDRIRG